VDNEGLPGQGLAPGVPTILKIINTVFCITRELHEKGIQRLNTST
jgi:hypothetical protein